MKKISSIISSLVAKLRKNHTETTICSQQQKRKKIIVVSKSAEHLHQYLHTVMSMVKSIMSEKDSEFVSQTQIGHILKRNKIVLPVSLEEFFKIYKSVFKTDVDVFTNERTVSLRPQYR